MRAFIPAALMLAFLIVSAQAQDDPPLSEQGAILHANFTQTLETFTKTAAALKAELGDQRRQGYVLEQMKLETRDFDDTLDDFLTDADDLKDQADQALKFLKRDGSPRVGGTDNRTELFEAIAMLYPAFDAVFADYLSVRAYNQIGRELIVARTRAQQDVAAARAGVYAADAPLPRTTREVAPHPDLLERLADACRDEAVARENAERLLMDVLADNSRDYVALWRDSEAHINAIRRDMAALQAHANADQFIGSGAVFAVQAAMATFDRRRSRSFEPRSPALVMFGPWPGEEAESPSGAPFVSAYFHTVDCFDPTYLRGGEIAAFEAPAFRTPPVTGDAFETADIDKLFAESVEDRAQREGETAWAQMTDAEKVLFLNGVRRLKIAQERLQAAVKAYEGGGDAAIEEGSQELWRSVVESTRAVSGMLRANGAGEISQDLLAQYEDIEEPLLEGGQQALRYGATTLGDALGLSGKFTNAADKVKAIKPFADFAKRATRISNLIDQTLKGAYESDPKNYFAGRLADLTVLGPRLGAAALNTSMALRVPQIPLSMVRRTVAASGRQYENAAGVLDGISRQLQGDTVGGQEQIDAAIARTRNMPKELADAVIPGPIKTVFRGVAAAKSAAGSFVNSVSEAFFGPSPTTPPPPADGPVDPEFERR
ncbi:MAG: hypothetical protein HOK98_13035 [Rhodospirillaceae bacterium]|jgi:hypothetical protein|nr:hypothetical protein [Rhodospirillaceae bacterium]MBT6404324.1 hypothetical protein [Rhodospirillaceae bacterium]MBT6537099.1 hypothetical protein [Rhodospirillaceae bacterium]